jgi:hypothetical protein
LPAAAGDSFDETHRLVAMMAPLGKAEKRPGRRRAEKPPAPSRPLDDRRRRLLDDFLWLARPACTDEAFVRFARRHGLLGVSHSTTEEDLGVWRREAQEIRNLLILGKFVVPKAMTSALLARTLAVLLSLAGQKFTKSDKSAVRRARIRAAKIVCSDLTSRLDGLRFRLFQPVPEGEKVVTAELDLFIPRLLDAISLQLAQEIEGPARLGICGYCGAEFIERKPKQKWCSAKIATCCQAAGTMARRAALAAKP